MDLKVLEGRIVKGIIVFLAVILGVILNGFALVMKDPNVTWMLFILIPAFALDIWLAIGAFKVLYKEYSN